jgi:hypothetical protein
MKTSAESTTIHNADSINKGLVIANIETFLKQVTKLKQNYEKISNTTVLSTTRAKADQDKKDAEMLLADTKIKASNTVDSAKYLSSTEKNNYKTTIEKATSADELNEIIRKVTEEENSRKAEKEQKTAEDKRQGRE